ncbi:uncharacterized protein CELE_F49B2.9 [Caenorhabditis elegans]|uniref:Uncharacterized protein n=1 Tax=Caenorhabditis elegans TaxID=6239 RepID=A0A0S4XRX6_CAEEL|nr:Uncharacterized protein CELE_F49B2.9 [Caenorhabditis elegans]CUV67055.1 Uncharacterized protein CELE_F49B2.9 [Caenorhabditis elegans]|eukprot:NP_001305201.1 Uncharacterized protein CELE_F49B2.9 [Caenorhabditis elegans]
MSKEGAVGSSKKGENRHDKLLAPGVPLAQDERTEKNQLRSGKSAPIYVQVNKKKATKLAQPVPVAQDRKKKKKPRKVRDDDTLSDISDEMPQRVAPLEIPKPSYTDEHLKWLILWKIIDSLEYYKKDFE